MKERKNAATRFSGNFFRPYSALEDGQSLACYYTQIYRCHENNDPEYPLSIVLTNTHFSVYWHGYMQRTDSNIEWDHYGVHQLFTDDFTDQYNAPIEEWMERERLVPPEMLNENPYTAITKREGKSNYREVYFQTFWHYAIKEDKKNTWDIFRILVGKIWTVLVRFFTKKEEKNKLEQIVFENFVLDLLFDLKHSSVFRGHPARDRFIGFLENVNRINAIWKKSEHRYNLYKLAELNTRQNRATQNQQLKYLSDTDEKSTAVWLDFLRTPIGEKSVKDNKSDNWFAGVEAEHTAVYQASKAEHLKKQAEDSIQWLIERYALGHAYWLQGFRVFGWRSFIILFISAVSYIIIRGHFPEAFSLWKDASQNHWIFSALLTLSGITLLLLLGLIIERILMMLLNGAGWVLNKFFPWKFLEKADVEAVLLSIPKIANLLKPKILLASTAAWALILSTDFVWDLDFRLSATKWVILGLLALVTFVFMATHITLLIERKLKGWKVFFRILILGFFSSIYSFMIGFVGMVATAEKHFVKDEHLPDYFKEFRIEVPKGDFVQNTNGNYLYLGKLQSLKSSRDFGDASFSFPPSEKQDSTMGNQLNREGWFSSKWLTYNGLHRLYHSCNHAKQNNAACRHNKVCLMRNADIGVDDDHSLDVHHLIIIVAEPLVFFTFVAVALGLMLEMGLQLNRAGIGFE